MGRAQRWIMIAAAGTVLAVLAAVTLIGDSTSIARADNQCAATCNAKHDQCMKSTNDRYTCDSQRNQCLKACTKG